MQRRYTWDLNPEWRRKKEKRRQCVSRLLKKAVPQLLRQKEQGLIFTFALRVALINVRAKAIKMSVLLYCPVIFLPVSFVLPWICIINFLVQWLHSLVGSLGFTLPRTTDKHHNILRSYCVTSKAQLVSKTCFIHKRWMPSHCMG